jgi:hypothetical protein
MEQRSVASRCAAAGARFALVCAAWSLWLSSMDPRFLWSSLCPSPLGGHQLVAMSQPSSGSQPPPSPPWLSRLSNFCAAELADVVGSLSRWRAAVYHYSSSPLPSQDAAQALRLVTAVSASSDAQLALAAGTAAGSAAYLLLRRTASCLAYALRISSAQRLTGGALSLLGVYCSGWGAALAFHAATAAAYSGQRSSSSRTTAVSASDSALRMLPWPFAAPPGSRQRLRARRCR